MFLVSLFGFGINVNAAEELTCLYNEEDGMDSSNYMYLLVQYGDGKIEVYRNRDNHYDLDAPGWTLFDNYIFDSSVVKDEIFFLSSSDAPQPIISAYLESLSLTLCFPCTCCDASPQGRQTS